MNKEEILSSVYNMIYEQDTVNKKKCLWLAEEITDFAEELIINKGKAKDSLIDLLYTQMIDLSLMSKIELGDDVILEIRRLKRIINN
jgi:hypothetical protein